MSLLIDPPFALGQTLGVSSLTDGTGWVGAVKQFPDVNPITGVIRSNRIKTCVAVRNVATIALAPKRVVVFSTAAGLGGISTVTGYASVLNAEHVGVVDEFLPTAGVAINDVFWVVVDGPTEVAGLVSGTAIAAGDRVAAVSAAASTGLTAGRVGPSLLSAASTNAGDAGRGVIGYAMSASSTSATTLTTGLGSPLCLVLTKY
jgi:hypothetical protein